MKTFALCVVGLAAGIGIGAATQYPVLETLGYLPDKDKNVAVSAETDAPVPSAQPDADSEADLEISETKLPERSTKPAPTIEGIAKKPETSATTSNRPMGEQYVRAAFESQGKELPYRLLRPATIEPGKNYPLVVFLHGAGERGSDNEAQLKNGSAEFARWVAAEGRNSFVLFPQCPKDDQWTDHNWTEVSHRMRDQPTQSMQAVLRLIDEMVVDEPIDDQRIYAAGLSMGGYGVFDLLARRPRVFAAGAALCGGTDCSPDVLKRLAGIPLYIVHGDEDNVVDVENSRQIVAGLKKFGGSPEYVEIPGVNHNCWSATFDNEKMFAWMFSKKLGASEMKASVADKGKKKTKKLPQKEVVKSADKVPLTPKEKKPSRAAKVKNQFVKKDELAGDRAPKIRKPADSPTSRKMVVGKPPLKQAKPLVEKAVQSKLSGKWKVIEAVHAGKEISADKLGGMSLEFVKDTLLIRQGKKTELGTVETGDDIKLGDIDASEIEIKSTRENVPAIKGFFFFEGETLTMVWGRPGNERPQSMNAKDLENSRVLKLLK